MGWRMFITTIRRWKKTWRQAHWMESTKASTSHTQYTSLPPPHAGGEKGFCLYPYLPKGNVSGFQLLGERGGRPGKLGRVQKNPSVTLFPRPLRAFDSTTAHDYYKSLLPSMQQHQVFLSDSRLLSNVPTIDKQGLTIDGTTGCPTASGCSLGNLPT